MNKFYFYSNFIFVLIFSISFGNLYAQEKKTQEDLFFVHDFTYLRDTVYTLKPYFIEVNLKTQKGFLYSRNGHIKEFGLSSGNEKLKDGVNTKEGLYVIQSMMPKWYSRQFDSTLMLNWMGFNYGIGFHALKSKGYYRHLGRRRSSHGCIRISRETAAELYSKIEIGTPVLIHSNNNAACITFIDSSANYKYYNSYKLIYFLKKKYTDFYAGRYFLDDEKVIVDDTNVSHPGLPIGERKRIPKNQILKPIYLFISSVTPEPKKVMPVWKKEAPKIAQILTSH